MVRLDTDLIGLPIVSMEDASVVAEVDALVIDDATLAVAGFLANVGLYEATILPYQAARAVGEDAIIVRSAAVLTPLSANPGLAALAEKGIEISGARIVTLTGQEVGSTGGYYVDDRGRVIGLELLTGSEEAGPCEEGPLVPISMVHRVGPDLVVMKQEYSDHLVNDPTLLERSASKKPAATPPVELSAPQARAPRSRTRKPGAGSEGSTETTATAPQTAPPAAETVKPKPTPRKPAQPAPQEETGPARHFLVGRRVMRRIEDAAGELIADEGDIVTPEMIQLARERDQLLILSLNVE